MHKLAETLVETPTPQSEADEQQMRVLCQSSIFKSCIDNYMHDVISKKFLNQQQLPSSISTPHSNK